MKIGKQSGIWGHIEPFRNDIVSIGDYFVLGAGSIIITHCPISFYNGKSVEINIGNYVYVGAHCIVLPGVNIGNNVVIGAGSVVSKDIPSNVVVAGNPCRIIRYMSETETQRLRLLAEQGLVADGKEPEWK